MTFVRPREVALRRQRARPALAIDAAAAIPGRRRRHARVAAVHTLHRDVRTGLGYSGDEAYLHATRPWMTVTARIAHAREGVLPVAQVRRGARPALTVIAATATRRPRLIQTRHVHVQVLLSTSDRNRGRLVCSG